MILRSDLRRIARARLRDAEALYRAGRYDGAAYLCGYAVELSLKARICRTLRWVGVPQSRKEFENYQSFKVHHLETLLRLSGVEDKIRTSYGGSWSAVFDWNPESRYDLPGTVKKRDTRDMIQGARIIMRVL
jgi:hypothetical protein